MPYSRRFIQLRMWNSSILQATAEWGSPVNQIVFLLFKKVYVLLYFILYANHSFSSCSFPPPPSIPVHSSTPLRLRSDGVRSPLGFSRAWLIKLPHCSKAEQGIPTIGNRFQNSSSQSEPCRHEPRSLEKWPQVVFHPLLPLASLHSAMRSRYQLSPLSHNLPYF